MIPLKDDNPVRITPLATGALITANVLVFFYQLSLGPQVQRLVYQYGSIPAVILGHGSLPAGLDAIPPVFSLFTSMFLHGGWLHLIGNMLYLWIFGDNIEAAMGRVRYLVFYLVCGALASASHIFSNPTSMIPSIGASGAISGVLGAYLMIYPRARVLVLVPLGFFSRILSIPAGFVLGFWFVLQLLEGAMSGAKQGGGVAFGLTSAALSPGCSWSACSRNETCASSIPPSPGRATPSKIPRPEVFRRAIKISVRPRRKSLPPLRAELRPVDSPASISGLDGPRRITESSGTTGSGRSPQNR